MSRNQAQEALVSQVQKRDLCTLCGACASLCPYFRSFGGRLVKLNDCDLETGRCFRYCPRGRLDLEEIHQSRHGDKAVPADLGPLQEMAAARATDPLLQGLVQTGGAVTALISAALKTGMIDAAILSRADESLLTQGRVARSMAQVRSCAGTSYVAGPTLETLNSTTWADETIGLVGLPCQLQALGQMRLNRELDPDRKVDRVGLTIGLFCTWALAYEPFAGYLEERFPATPIIGMDITPPPERLLKVRTREGDQDIPLDQIREFIRPGCKVCLDMTAETADISVGTVEGLPGWNTVILRTARGRELWEKALEAKALEAKPLGPDKEAHLKAASLLKKARAIKALEERGNLQDSYLVLDSDYGKRILAAVEGVEP